MTAATGSSVGNLTLANGSITDSSGAISFGNENLSTTGTLASGALTVTGTGSFSSTLTANAGINVKNGATGPGFIDFYEDSDNNGTNKLKLKPADGDLSDVTVTLPNPTLVGTDITDINQPIKT